MTAPRYAFAHRGGRGHGPDNTLPTFRAALAQGATGLETDAWVTADGAVVLDHDGVLRTARRRRKPMEQVRRDELPAHVPTLDELYAAVGTDVDLAVDVRRPEVAAAAVDVARRFGATDRLWLVASSTDLLAGWRELDPAVHLAVTLRFTDRRWPCIMSVRDAGAQALNLRWPWWSRRLVRRVHALGLAAFAYDAQRALSLRRCAQLGCDGVFSDSVPRLLAVVTAARDPAAAPGGDGAASAESAVAPPDRR